MRDSRPQSLEFLFDSASDAGNGPLRDIQQRALALLKLNRAVRGLLPAQLHPWCRVANYRQGLLVLEAASANWLMRLRYEQPTLLSALRAQILPSLASIDIRINPALAAKGHEIVQNNGNSAQPAVQQAPRRQLSTQSAQTLRDLAGHSPEKLRKILERLASLAGESTSKTSRDSD
ncbi:DUF721 domain-containing protein [Affinibrenneria salicis]|uniref:DUF721 domain-containing protein n=1 Tax=Affinibrenneria salicis TaxID=2590031 RepID=A0A5J5G7I2_9GAMM|nr:DUF721 domain-containing protein [Affinibrenneria salicis]KAA9002595.1 DUF721 domain-containing protein [Affinibrenneria salicis]KAA9003117.1 DUF721 domain-containing protein [Affinibrenneria salicis]